MIITSKTALNFCLWGSVTRSLAQISPTVFQTDVVAVLTQNALVQASPGAEQSVPDWVRFDQLFLLALEAGNVTLVTPPVNSLAWTISANQASVELPLSGSPTSVYVSNTSATAGSNVVNYNGPGLTWIGPGNTVQLPLAGNSISVVLDDNATSGSIGLVCA